MRKIISFDAQTDDPQAAASGVRNRRYAIRFPFAAEAELLDLKSGARATGITSDISLGGCFVCTSRPLPVGARGRLSLTRRGETVEVLSVVRVVKPRLGMGLEFLDLDDASHAVFLRWVEDLRRAR